MTGDEKHMSMATKDGRPEVPGRKRRMIARITAVACSMGMLFACSGCSVNDISSFFRGHSNEVQRKAKEVPRDPDFSPVFNNGG